MEVIHATFGDRSESTARDSFDLVVVSGGGGYGVCADGLVVLDIVAVGIVVVIVDDVGDGGSVLATTKRKTSLSPFWCIFSSVSFLFFSAFVSLASGSQ